MLKMSQKIPFQMQHETKNFFKNSSRPIYTVFKKIKFPNTIKKTKNFFKNPSRPINTVFKKIKFPNTIKKTKNFFKNPSRPICIQ